MAIKYFFYGAPFDSQQGGLASMVTLALLQNFCKMLFDTKSKKVLEEQFI